MATTNVSIRMDSDLKAQADALFAELGMNLSTAFNIFVRQSLREVFPSRSAPSARTRRPWPLCWKQSISRQTRRQRSIGIWMSCLRIWKNERNKANHYPHHPVPQGL